MKEHKLGFIGQLDSFRFFAVFLVIISHWLPSTSLNKIPNGFLGVSFFFVLSGFLISTNLFYAKESIKEKNLTNKKALINFYIRRFLRIFPLYYLCLFLIWKLNKNIFEGNINWYLFYASNFLIFLKQHWQESLSHFWSLAVEEQFYLIWPFVILFMPVRFFCVFLAVIITLSMLYKVIMPFFWPIEYIHTFTFSAFDAFGLGTLLAYQKVYGLDLRLLSIKNLNYILPVSILAIVLCVYNYRQPIIFIWPYFSILIIAKALNGYKGIAGYVLNNSAFRYLGKISYGIYVYHNFIPWFTRCLQGQETKYPIMIKPLLINWHPPAIFLLIFEFCFLIFIATVSWFCFEKPLNSFKQYFSY